MPYVVLYDLRADTAFEPATAWLAGGIVLLGLIWAVVRRRQGKRATTGYVLMGFGSLLALIGVGLMAWDHQRLLRALERGEAKVVEGPIQSWGTERQVSARKQRREVRTYERFYVGDRVWFGYYWEIEQAGFHNQGSPRVQLRDGMRVRATYLHADGADQPPRIVKLETLP